MTEELNQVTNPNGGQVSTETPPASGVLGGQETAPQGTPTQEPGDADALRQQLLDMQRQFRETTEKYERDIRGMKSSLQSRHFQDQTQWKQQAEQLQQRIRELETRGMNESERVVYEQKQALERARQIEEENQSLRQYVESQRRMQEYAQSFVQMGVKPENLDYSTPEALVSSGWAAIGEELKKYREAQQASQGSQTSQSHPGTQAPPTGNRVQGSPPAGPALEDSIKRYGSLEGLYAAIEQGYVRAEDVLPGLRRQ